MTNESLLYYYGTLFGIVIVFYICYRFCFKKREWGENP